MDFQGGDDAIGDDGAPAWVARTFADLVGALGLYCGDLGIAEDCAQEAIVRLWARGASIDDPRAWAFRVAFNVASSTLRRRTIERRAVRVLTATAQPRPLPDADSSVDVRRALRTLSPRQRQAVVLHYLADLAVPQVAAVMGCSTGAVKSHLARGLQALRDNGSLDFADPATDEDSR